jgi:hypothetical protein
MAVPSFRICSTSLAALQHIALRKRNYRAELTVLSVGRFAGFGAGHVPEYPTDSVCRRRETPQFHRARCEAIVGKSQSASQEKRG